MGEIVHYLPYKKHNFGCLSNCRYCADRARNLRGPAPNSWLIVLHISSRSVRFGAVIAKRVNLFFCMASVIPDLWLPSQLQTGTKSYCLVA